MSEVLHFSLRFLSIWNKYAAEGQRQGKLPFPLQSRLNSIQFHTLESGINDELQLHEITIDASEEGEDVNDSI
jgi:hypothetical protein